QQLTRSVWMKVNADHPERTGCTKKQGSGDLTDKETLRLALPPAFRPGFIGMAQVQDQLCAAIRNNALDAA
ncbi:MAG: hypothetical protein WCB11_09280, partial [Terriglobales bacterium]